MFLLESFSAFFFSSNALFIFFFSLSRFSISYYLRVLAFLRHLTFSSCFFYTFFHTSSRSLALHELFTSRRKYYFLRLQLIALISFRDFLKENFFSHLFSKLSSSYSSSSPSHSSSFSPHLPSPLPPPRHYLLFSNASPPITIRSSTRPQGRISNRMYIPLLLRSMYVRLPLLP